MSKTLAEIFNHSAFSLISLTTGYNSSTHIDDEVLKLFEVENVENRMVMLVKADKRLQVLLPGEIGTNPNIDKHDAENAVPVSLIRYPFDTQIVPSDLNRINSLQDKKLKATELAVLVKSQMGKHKDNHKYTSAFTAYSALKGVVKSKNGKTLIDLYNAFGTKQRQVDLKLSTDSTDIPALLSAMRKKTMKTAKDHGHLTLKGVSCRIGQEMIEKILNHESVKKFYSTEIHAKRVITFADDPTKINICGIEFITDEADAVCLAGASYPKGAKGLFGMLRAPADVMSSSSTSKRECHITTEPMPHDEGLTIRSRAIYLPIVRDPDLLCEIYSSN